MDAEHNDHQEPVIVASFSTLGEAEVAEAKLRAYGIDSSVHDLIEGGSLPVEDEPGVNIVVRPGDAEDARRVLAADDAGTAEDPVP